MGGPPGCTKMFGRCSIADSPLYTHPGNSRLGNEPVENQRNRCINGRIEQHGSPAQ